MNKEIQQTNNQLTKEDNPALPASLMRLLPTLPPDMAEVAKVKYSGPRLASIPEIDYSITCKSILAQICATTGWDMPQNPFMSNAVVSAFEAYCKEYLSDMTGDEILYSFRRFGLNTKDWGKAINLQLINDPIQSYREVRREISDIEDSIPCPDPHDYISGDEDWSDSWDRLIYDFDPNNSFYQFIPWTIFYDWLKRTGKIEINEEFVQQARDEELGILQRKANPTPQDKNEIERMKCIDWRKDQKVLRYISTRVKTIHAKQLLIKLQKEKNENNIGCSESNRTD